MKLAYTVNLFDNEGDIFEEGIFIHIGNTTIIKFKNIKEYEEFIENLISMKPQIAEEIKNQF